MKILNSENFTKIKSILLVIKDDTLTKNSYYSDSVNDFIDKNSAELVSNLKEDNFRSYQLSDSLNHIFVYKLAASEKSNNEAYRVLAGNYAKELKKLKINQFALLDSNFNNRHQVIAFFEALGMSIYEYNEFKSNQEDTFEFQEVAINSDKYNNAIEEANTISEAVNYARDLCLKPGNALTPTIFANLAKDMSKNVGLKCTILDEEEMAELKMGSLLSVSKGSDEEAKLIIMEHQPSVVEINETIVLVGKGLTFDAGGISIKPSANMHLMKKDMSGGAAVFAAMKLIAKMNLPIKVIGIIPSSENLLNGKAVKPGDIVIAADGTSIEVLNTDAEGRLILCDALLYARKYNPDQIIDIATLTGAVSVALGDQASGLLGNDDKLIEELKQAGVDSHERVWELPLYKEYSAQLKSPVADLANVGGRNAGTITAAAFLSHFVKEYKWAHLDIAGTSWGDRKTSYLAEGSTGVGVRLFYYFLKNKLKK